MGDEHVHEVSECELLEPPEVGLQLFPLSLLLSCPSRIGVNVVVDGDRNYLGSGLSLAYPVLLVEGVADILVIGEGQLDHLFCWFST